MRYFSRLRSNLRFYISGAATGTVESTRYDNRNPCLVHVYVRAGDEVRDVVLPQTQAEGIRAGDNFSGKSLRLCKLFDTDRIRYGDLP